MPEKVNIYGIVEEDTVNAPGISFTVFVQGCWHPDDLPNMFGGHCKGCHNPGTHSKEGGKEYTVEMLYQQFASNPLQNTLVLSGGEPMNQWEPLTKLAKLVKSSGHKVWMYSGYTFEQLQKYIEGWKEIAQYLDVLVDGPFIPDMKSMRLKFRGSKNQRIIDVQASLKKGKPVLMKLRSAV